MSKAPVDVFSPTALSGKVCIITGGASGICLGITKCFLEHGATCVIMSRTEDKLQSATKLLASQVPNSSSRISYQVCDVREQEQIEKAVSAVVSAHGRINILVNGAAGNFLVPAHKISARAFRTVMEIDTVGTFLMSQSVMNKAFIKQKSGVILNISMNLHYTGMPMQAHAGAAKSAIDGLTKHLAVEWGKLANVRVNSVAPGAIASTEGFKRLLPDKMSEDLQKMTPLTRFGCNEDIALASLYLCSDAAAFVSGSTLVVDGGAWMTQGGISLSYL
eukprot:ANDGO_05380.mRNA.1 Peroxisomal 2